MTNTRTYFASVLLFSILAFSLLTGCAGRPVGRPPGNRIASCKGKIRLDGGRTTGFRLDAYHTSENDLTIYLTMPGKMLRYAIVEDISFEEDVIVIETSSPDKKYCGTLAGDTLEFDGRLDAFSGSFMLNLDN